FSPASANPWTADIRRWNPPRIRVNFPNPPPNPRKPEPPPPRPKVLAAPILLVLCWTIASPWASWRRRRSSRASIKSVTSSRVGKVLGLDDVPVGQRPGHELGCEHCPQRYRVEHVDGELQWVPPPRHGRRDEARLHHPVPSKGALSSFFGSIP